MLVIRLARTGRRNKATFRVVLQEKSQSPKSKHMEILGSYNPHLKERADQIQLKEDRIKYWLSEGAQPSNTMHNMLIEFGIIEGKKRRSVQPKLKKVEEGEAAAAAAPAGGDKPAEGEKPTDDAKPEEKVEEKKEEVKEEPKEEKKEEKPEEKKAE